MDQSFKFTITRELLNIVALAFIGLRVIFPNHPFLILLPKHCHPCLFRVAFALEQVVLTAAVAPLKLAIDPLEHRWVPC